MPKIACVACLLHLGVPASAEEGFTPLLNGTDLSGWMNGGDSHEFVVAELRERHGRGSII